MLNGKPLFLAKALVHPKISAHYILASEDAVLMIISYEKSIKKFLRIHHLNQPLPESTPLILKTIGELKEYFKGKRRMFTVPVLFTGSLFQRKVYQTLFEQVQYGETISYEKLAERAGYPRAARAAGTAMKNNPLPFIIPCHRVIHSDGSIGQYAGGTVLKEFLIKLESSQK